MNKQEKLNLIGGLWLLINIPVIPFVGSIFYGLPAGLALALSLVVFAALAVLSRSFNVAVIASICVVAIALMRLDSIHDYLGSRSVDSLMSSLVIAIIVAIIAVCTIVYKLFKKRNFSLR